MKKALFFGAIVLLVGAAFVYWMNDSDEESSTRTSSPTETRGASTASGEQQSGAGDVAASQTAAETSRPSDPRLAALAVSKENSLIEFVPGPDGKIIKEIDNDPSSLGYRKPSREYTYAGANVVGLVAYQYFSDHVQITRTQVMYKPDGTVDRFLESTSYEYANKRSDAAR